MTIRLLMIHTMMTLQTRVEKYYEWTKMVIAYKKNRITCNYYIILSDKNTRMCLYCNCQWPTFIALVFPSTYLCYCDLARASCVVFYIRIFLFVDIALSNWRSPLQNDLIGGFFVDEFSHFLWLVKFEIYRFWLISIIFYYESLIINLLRYFN